MGLDEGREQEVVREQQHRHPGTGQGGVGLAEPFVAAVRVAAVDPHLEAGK
jgi:hypothetical protein